MDGDKRKRKRERKRKGAGIFILPVALSFFLSFPLTLFISPPLPVLLLRRFALAPSLSSSVNELDLSPDPLLPVCARPTLCRLWKTEARSLPHCPHVSSAGISLRKTKKGKAAPSSRPRRGARLARCSSFRRSSLPFCSLSLLENSRSVIFLRSRPVSRRN